MKKLLLSLSLLATVCSASAQVLAMDDFSSYTVGNVGVDPTGATTGQGDWYTAGAANSDFQIVNNAAHGNYLQITGSATATGNKFMWTSDFETTWAFRDAGNDILSIEYEFFTGPATTSKNQHRVCVFNADGLKILGGLLFAEDTKVLSGLSYYNNAGTMGNYSFNPTTGPFVLPTNTWVKIGFSFNKTTGQVICRTKGLTTNLNMGIPGAAMGIDPVEIDLITAAGALNTSSTLALYDSYLVIAAATDALLDVEQVQPTTAFAVFPNPATNVINVNNKDNAPISSITFSDLNGRIVKQNAFNNESQVQMNISELSSGVYMMNITSKEGTTTKKIVKN